MQRVLCITAAFFLAWTACTAPTVTPTAIPVSKRSVAEIVNELRLSVVRINTRRSRGTGIFVRSDGMILTGPECFLGLSGGDRGNGARAPVFGAALHRLDSGL